VEKTSVDFWHVQSAESMHQGTSIAVPLRQGMSCMMLLPPIHAPQSPNVFYQFQTITRSLFHGFQDT